MDVDPNEPDPEDSEEDFAGDFISNSDQMLAQMTEVARASAAYCATLMQNGIPAEVAFKMMTDWHQSYWIGAHAAAMDVFGDEYYGMDDDEDEDE